MERNTPQNLRFDVAAVESIAADREHGASHLSLRAMEILRNQAVGLEQEGVSVDEAWDSLSNLAWNLLAARPTMVVLRNRINRVMHASRERRTAEAVMHEARQAIERSTKADEEVSRRAAGYIAGRRVFTLSRSGTVLAAIRRAELPPSVVIAASEPGREGVDVAEELARDGFSVKLVADAAMASVLTEQHVDVVLVGADTVLRTGAIVNKVGTHLALLAARQQHIPRYVVAASDKVSHEDTAPLEHGEAASLYAGEAFIQEFNPIFEVTPAQFYSGIITEFGILAPDEMRDLAYEMKALAEW